MPAAVSDSDAVKLRTMLGLPDAPMVDEGIRTTVAFFRETLGADPFAWISYIRGIDFHSPVECLTLRPLVKLSRHRNRGEARRKPFAYFTVPGTSPYSTGTSFPESDFELFFVPYEMKCLKSRASGIKFHPTDRVFRGGGGAQFILSATDASRLTKIR